jgi:hypothetical protein
MDGTVKIARIEPQIAHLHRPYHVLLRNDGTSICWHWDRKNALWARGGNEYPPERLAADGWVYDHPMIPTDEPASAPAPAATMPLTGATIVNALGYAVAVEHVPGRRLLEHQTVGTLIEKAAALRLAMEAFKQAAYADIDAFKEILFAQYGARVGGSKNGIKLHSFDMKQRVEVSSATTVTFGPELDAAKALVDECLERWLSEGSNQYVRTIVMDAFKVGDGGSISPDRVLALRQYEIPDAQWQRAMTAIDEARRAAESRRFIRFHTRETPDGEWKQIVLDASRV